jgi:hypothetical protein
VMEKKMMVMVMVGIAGGSHRRVIRSSGYPTPPR